MLFDGKKGCKNLGRVELVRKAIPYRNPAIFCQIFHSFLAKASVFDAIEHPAKDFCRIADGFLLSDLRPLGVKIHRVHTQVCSSHFKGTAGSCAGLFEDEGYILSFMDSVAYTFFLHFFELCSFIKHISNLFRCKIQKGKKALSFEIYLWHLFFLQDGCYVIDLFFNLFFGCSTIAFPLVYTDLQINSLVDIFFKERGVLFEFIQRHLREH